MSLWDTWDPIVRNQCEILWANGRVGTRLPRKPLTIEELKAKLIELWAEITVDQVRNLYRGMPGRLVGYRVYSYG